MAAGDAQRIWFGEMVAALRLKWRRDMPFEEMIRLRDELDEMLQQIRSNRNVRSPVVRCSKCGYIGEGAAPHVTVRAMILSVIRFDIDDGDTTRAVEKQWKAYQKTHRLDLNGKPAGPKVDHLSRAHGHSH